MEKNLQIWVCRTGEKGQFEKLFLNNNEIYLTRDNLEMNLLNCSKETIISAIKDHENKMSRQSISNIWSQINIFVNLMTEGDIIIIPQKSSRIINVGIITSDYKYQPNQQYPCTHSRSIKILRYGIDASTFPSAIKYSLGAFRTIFNIKQVDKLLEVLVKEGCPIEV